MNDNYCIPFVAAIIERQHNGKTELLIQTRYNPNRESIYNGTFEFAAGTLDKAYENVYEAIAREIKEETGMTLKRVINDSQTEVFKPQEVDAVFGFKPFCCVQQLREGRPWVGFIFRCEVEDGTPVGQEGESKDVHWVAVEEVKTLFEQTPEKLFTLEVPAWSYYFNEVVGKQEGSNQTTLESYEANVQKYIQGTPQDVSGDVKEWIDHALSEVKAGGNILELGSAFGRDATYIEAKGFTVERTDATKAFVDLLQGQGHKARVLNAITDDFGGTYDMVIANAVLLHFKPDETKLVLEKMYQSLAQGGVAAFTVKRGDGESWSEDKLNAPRYFCYWQADGLRKVVEGAGFEITELTNGSTKNADWLQVIAKKTA